MPLIRERGDFCRGDVDNCAKGVLRYKQTKILPSFLNEGRHNLKTLIYNESKIPIACKSFYFVYEYPKVNETILEEIVNIEDSDNM